MLNALRKNQSSFVEIFLKRKELIYPFGFVNIAETFELVPRCLLVRKLSKVVEFEWCVITAWQQVSHPVEGDSAEERRGGVHIGAPHVIEPFNGIPPALLHLSKTEISLRMYSRWENRLKYLSDAMFIHLTLRGEENSRSKTPLAVCFYQVEEVVNANGEKAFNTSVCFNYKFRGYDRYINEWKKIYNRGKNASLYLYRENNLNISVF